MGVDGLLACSIIGCQCSLVPTKSERAAAPTATLSFTSRLRSENHEACEQYRKAVTPVKLSFLRSQVLPIGVAMQKASSLRSSLRSSRFKTHQKISRIDWLRAACRFPQGDRPRVRQFQNESIRIMAMREASEDSNQRPVPHQE